MSSGLQCDDLLHAREQIAHLVNHYIGTHKIEILPTQSNGSDRSIKVGVQLRREDESLSDYDFMANFGYWGSYYSRVSVGDSFKVASYRFWWRG